MPDPPPLSKLAHQTRALQSANPVELTMKRIESIVPCFTGPIPIEWTNRVIDELKSMGVSPATIGKAMQALRERGYELVPTVESIRLGYNFAEPKEPRHAPSMGAPSDVEDRRASEEKLKFMYAQLQQAQRAGNAEVVKRLSGQIAWLEWNLQNTDRSGSNTENANNSSGGGQSGTSPATTTESSDKVRRDGLQGESQGGAPLLPPPENIGRAPRNNPKNLPTPDHPDLNRGIGGPLRTPGRR